MQVDELLPFLRENQDTLIRKIRDGKYKPNPVRRVEIPKETEGEFRKLGVPTVVETVVLLSRKTPDDTIEVDLDLDELDITAAESKATYQEIKDYVLKEFGLKVSTLYISQIKRKCGIDVGEHYNISQKENQKVPQCPKEKEDAIRAALEHFAMI